jgi:hypothetical protein
MIEILESRIAPAAVFYFTDLDGDHVKISSSAGTNTELANAVTLSNYNVQQGKLAVGTPHQLETLTLGAAFAGASISITATPSNDLNPSSPAKSGNGFVNVGEILAGSIDLKSVTVHGDLGQIVVGQGNNTSPGKTPGLGSLNVQSMGDFGLTTGANSVDSRFINGVTSIKIADDANGVLLRADASGSDLTTAKIGSVYIGGNLIGGSAMDTGEIAADIIGSVKIMQSVIGGSAMQTGRIATNIGGNIDSTGGGVAANDGGNIGSIYIGGSLVGGSAQATGVVYSPTNVGSVTIRGSVLGGSAITSGGIDGANIGSVAIGGDLRGTEFDGSAAVDHTAFIRAQTNLKSVTIGGSIVSGIENGGGTLTFSGAIQAGQTLGAVKVLGSIVGTATQTVVISGAGLAAPTKLTQDPAIKSVSVAGSATYAMIEGGYDLGGNPAGGDAQIGKVSIGGDLIASDIIAGVKSTTAEFGASTDTLIDKPGGSPGAAGDGILASIASIVVAGQIEGTVATGDTFAIEAQLIGSIITGGLKLPLTPGPGNDDLFISQTTGHDVHIRELPGT